MLDLPSAQQHIDESQLIFLKPIVNAGNLPAFSPLVARSGSKIVVMCQILIIKCTTVSQRLRKKAVIGLKSVLLKFYILAPSSIVIDVDDRMVQIYCRGRAAVSLFEIDTVHIRSMHYGEILEKSLNFLRVCFTIITHTLFNTEVNVRSLGRSESPVTVKVSFLVHGVILIQTQHRKWIGCFESQLLTSHFHIVTGLKIVHRTLMDTNFFLTK